MRRLAFLELPVTQEFLKTVAGDFAVDVVRTWNNKQKEISDEEIANKLKVKVTEIRTTLNRLHYRGIACYQKSRNSKTGWYSYTWNVKTSRIAELVMERQAEEIQKISKKMDFEKNYIFFNCKTGCTTVPFEIAAEYQFKCPECGKNLNEENSEKKLKELNKRIDLIKEDLQLMQKSQ